MATAKVHADTHLDTLLRELFDDGEHANDADNPAFNFSIAPRCAGHSELLQAQAAAGQTGRQAKAGQEMHDFFQHPLLTTLEASMTSFQLCGSSRPVRTNESVSAQQSTSSVVCPLPGLAILRGALSPDQQLGVAADILRSGCLADEGATGGGGTGADGYAESGERSGADANVKYDAGGGAGDCGRRRPKGLPNQAMFFGDLPDWALRLSGLLPLDALLPADLAARRPPFDQAIVNLYRPGEGICSHVDLARFQDGIISVSIGGPAVMHFTRLDGTRVGEAFGGGYGSGGGGSGGGGCCYGSGRAGNGRPAAREEWPATVAAGEAAAEDEGELFGGKETRAHVQRAGKEVEDVRQQCAAQAAEEPIDGSPSWKRLRRCSHPGEWHSRRQRQQRQQVSHGTRDQQKQPTVQCSTTAAATAKAAAAAEPEAAAASPAAAGRATDGAAAIVAATAGAAANALLATAALQPQPTGQPRLRCGRSCCGSSRGDSSSNDCYSLYDEGVWWCGLDHLCVLLQGGDLLGMAGEARYGWEHGIRPVVLELWGETGCDRCTAAAGSRHRRSDEPSPRSLPPPQRQQGQSAAVEPSEATTLASAAWYDGGGRGIGPPPVPITRAVRLSVTLRRLCPDIVLCEK